MTAGSDVLRRVATVLPLLAGILCWPGGLSAGRPDTSIAPAKRLVATAPHLVELVYFMEAGDLLVAVDGASDYPPSVRHLPRIGGPQGLNIESVLAFKPDLVLVWESGTPAWQIERLQTVGIKTWVSEIRRLDDIPAWLIRFGELTGHSKKAKSAAGRFGARLREIEHRVQRGPAKRVFLQILDNSLYTLSDRHVLSDVLRRCGGKNVMGHLPALAPRVEIESVLAANPEVIIASGDRRHWETWLARWRNYPRLNASRNNRIVYIPADLLHRPGPRLLDGMERVCSVLSR